MAQKFQVPTVTKDDMVVFSEQIRQAIQENRDPREIAYQEIVRYLFDDSKLLFVSRVSEEQIRNILYNKIVIHFYQEYYSEVNVTITLRETDEPPYYERVVDYGKFSKDVRSKFLGKYKTFVDEYMSLLVSLKGKGREEALKVLESSNERIEKEKLLKGVVG